MIATITEDFTILEVQSVIQVNASIILAPDRLSRQEIDELRIRKMIHP